MHIETPYYLVDEQKLLNNLKRVQFVRQHAGAKVILALKCFSTWPLFPLISQYMDGTTSSSLYEARLGYEEFGKEVHAYSVAFSDRDLAEVVGFADKVIFNSLYQLQRFHSSVSHLDVGLRINPQVSYSPYPMADPARRYSRLGCR
jgi:carboxynorspermidine decarboxylase